MGALVLVGPFFGYFVSCYYSCDEGVKGCQGTYWLSAFLQWLCNCPFIIAGSLVPPILLKIVNEQSWSHDGGGGGNADAPELSLTGAGSARGASGATGRTVAGGVSASDAALGGSALAAGSIISV